MTYSGSIDNITGGTNVRGGTVVFSSDGVRSGNDVLRLNNSSATPGNGSGGVVIIKGAAGLIGTYVSQMASAYDQGAWDNVGFDPNAKITTDQGGGSGVFGVGYIDGQPARHSPRRCSRYCDLRWRGWYRRK